MVQVLPAFQKASCKAAPAVNFKINEHQQAYEHYRAMLKAGTPTDNAIEEVLNAWIKAALHLDFDRKTAGGVSKLPDEYVHYINRRQSAVASVYKSPVQHKTELDF